MLAGTVRVVMMMMMMMMMMTMTTTTTMVIMLIMTMLELTPRTQASTLVAGDEGPSDDRDEYEYVTEAYGAVSQSAKVTKHVSRVKLPSNGLTWNEDLLVRGSSTDPSLLTLDLFRSTTRVGKVRPPWLK